LIVGDDIVHTVGNGSILLLGTNDDQSLKAPPQPEKPVAVLASWGFLIQSSNE